jgi:two-component system sensor histidine kinase PilS (NtrC family)
MRIIFETGQNFSMFLAARLVFVTVLLGVAILFRSSGDPLFPCFALMAANASLSVGCWEWYRKARRVAPVPWFALTTAVILDTLVLFYTGRADTEFMFLYFFSIGSAGLLAGLPASLWVAVLSTAGLLWLYHGGSGRFLEDYGLRALIYAVNFLLTALITAYVHEKLRGWERTHQRTLGELEQTRLDTQAILDSLSTGVLVLNPERKVLYSNPAGRVILGLAETCDTDEIQRVIEPRAVMGDALHPLLTNSTAEPRNEIDLPLPGGDRPIGFSVSAFQDKEGNLRGHIVLFSDLTRSKEVERQQRERERLAAIGGLSRELAHEIRNPLATVRGCVEMIRRDCAEDDGQPYLDLALRESDRLNRLLRDFLAYAHLDTPRKRPGDLSALVRRRSVRPPDGITISDHLSGELTAQFDQDQLELVVDAILLSLFEWAEGSAEIRIEPSVAIPRGIRFLLAGQTIPADAKDAVFRPFSGVQRTSTGLGLATAMRATMAHGGTLIIETEPGVGTWFELAI